MNRRLGTPRKKSVSTRQTNCSGLIPLVRPEHEGQTQYQRDGAGGECDFNGALKAGKQELPGGEVRKEIPIVDRKLTGHIKALQYDGDECDHGNERNSGAGADLGAHLGAGSLVERVTHGRRRGGMLAHRRILTFLSM